MPWRQNYNNATTALDDVHQSTVRKKCFQLPLEMRPPGPLTTFDPQPSNPGSTLLLTVARRRYTPVTSVGKQTGEHSHMSANLC